MERRTETLSARRDRMNREAAARRAADNRRAYWQGKAEAEESPVWTAWKAEQDRQAVGAWLARFHAARNAACTGSL